MIGKGRKYKNLDFTDKTQITMQRAKGYSFPLQDYKAKLKTRTKVNLNENYHGGTLSTTLYGVRYFDFEGVALGLDKKKRGDVVDILKKNLNIESNPQADPYFILSWLTDNDRAVFCKTKVSESVSFKNGLDDIQIPYSFQLASPSEKYYGKEKKSIKFGLGFVGGQSLSVGLSSSFGSCGGYTIANNEGTRQAPIRLQIIGKCTNPKIINLTNGQKYRISGITNNLVYDNQNSDFETNKELIVEDFGQNIKTQRTTGGQIYLEPGENKLVVLSDDPEDSPEIFLVFRDTYS